MASSTPSELKSRVAESASRAQAFQVMKTLADETRFEVYCLVQDSPTPLSVHEIAERLGLHPNTVRPHLERLREAGLVTIEPVLSGKVGRPVHLYSATPRRPAALVGERALRVLRGVIAETLGELISEYGASPGDAYELGRIWGRQIRESAEHSRESSDRTGKPADSSTKRRASGRRPSPDRDAESWKRAASALVDDLDLLGFEPGVESDGESFVVVFGDCPYRDLARSSPEIVCTVHKAICDESLACAASDMEVLEFQSIEDGEPCRMRVGRD